MPDCPVTPFYSLLFKIMGLLNLLLFLYAILTLFSAKYDFIHLSVSLDTISLVALLTASALGIFGWKYLLCNLITAGAFLFLAFPCCAFTCISGNRLYIHTTALLNSCSCIHASCRVAEIKEDEKIKAYSNQISGFVDDTLVTPALRSAITSSFSRIIPPAITGTGRSLQIFPITFASFPEEPLPHPALLPSPVFSHFHKP